MLKVLHYEDMDIPSASKFHEDQVFEIEIGISQNVDVSVYAKPELSSEQMRIIRECLSQLVRPEEAAILANPKFTISQMEQIAEGLEEGLDVSVYAKPEYNWQQMREIRLGIESDLNVSIYANPDYKWEQMREIRDGLDGGLIDVSVYATPKYDWRQMREIQLGLLSEIDISAYASSCLSWEEMAKIRYKLEREQEEPEFN